MKSALEQKPQLTPNWIDNEALRIVQKLQGAGHTTFLVGGCVRDLLLGIHPKDFDISTSAHPHQVKRLIPYSYIIGRRFRLVLVKRQDLQFEVSTFRKLQTEDSSDGEEPTGPITDDNEFGTPKDDAWRRDFTVNGLFYDPNNNELIDHVDGMRDIKSGFIRMIGEPLRRLEEDPIRILRALRMAHKVQFSIEPELREAIEKKADTLQGSVLPRRREEMLKWLRLPSPSQIFLEAYDLGVLRQILPSAHKIIEDNPKFMELFLFHLDQGSETHHFNSTPKDLFATLLFAFYRSLYEAQDRALPSENLTDIQPFAEMMRDELGMFKYEQHDIARALQMLHLFPKLKDFKKRSASRQLAFFKNESFLMALQLAKTDYLLDPQALREWREMYERFLPEMEAPSKASASSTARRRRPPRRRTQKARQRS